MELNQLPAGAINIKPLWTEVQVLGGKVYAYIYTSNHPENGWQKLKLNWK